MRRAHLTMMIKPASAACNLACDYCFYLDEASNREVACHPFMTDEVMDNIIKKSLSEAMHCSYAFQGGEPSLVGLPFFERFVSKVNELKGPDSEISYAFQTNGLNLDEKWAKFFKTNKFLVGVSFDGNPRMNDLHRKDHLGKGHGRDVMQVVSMLKQEGVDFNILTVVTNELAQNIKPVYTYLVNHDLFYHQYIACMDPIQGGKNFLSPIVYGQFLKDLFDLWFDSLQGGKPVSIRFFDNLVGMLVGYPPESCDMAGICSANYVVEGNGNIYPCDFFCTDDQLLGNIVTDSFGVFDAKRIELRFIEDSQNKINACDACPWKNLCRGGCKRERLDGGYRFCSSMKEFYPYAIRRLEHLAGSIARKI